MLRAVRNVILRASIIERVVNISRVAARVSARISGNDIVSYHDIGGISLRGAKRGKSGVGQRSRQWHI